MNYRERIRALREDNDYTQTYIASILNVGQRTYADYELGKTRIPVESLIRLAEFYNVDMNYITGLNNTITPFPNSFYSSTNIYTNAKLIIRGHYMIYENIRNLREDNGKTQKELADYLNVKQTTYSKYELGKINIPVEVFIKLADYYGVSVDYLLGRTKKK